MKDTWQSKNTLRLFFFITAVVGWATAAHEQGLLRRFSPLGLALIDALISFIALAVALALQQEGKGVTSVRQDLSGMTIGDAALLLGLGIYGALAGLMGTLLLKNHPVDRFRLTDLFVSILVGAVGLHVFSTGPVRPLRFVGLGLLATGGYLVLRM
jgi:DMSO reductase anchor subunit